MPNKNVSDKIPRRNPEEPRPEETTPSSLEKDIRQAGTDFEKFRSAKTKKSSGQEVMTDEEANEVDQEIAEKEMHHPQM